MVQVRSKRAGFRAILRLRAREYRWLGGKRQKEANINADGGGFYHLSTFIVDLEAN